jgi:hypothetical protein
MSMTTTTASLSLTATIVAWADRLLRRATQGRVALVAVDASSGGRPMQPGLSDGIRAFDPNLFTLVAARDVPRAVSGIEDVGAQRLIIEGLQASNLVRVAFVTRDHARGLAGSSHARPGRLLGTTKHDRNGSLRERDE